MRTEQEIRNEIDRINKVSLVDVISSLRQTTDDHANQMKVMADNLIAMKSALEWVLNDKNS